MDSNFFRLPTTLFILVTMLLTAWPANAAAGENDWRGKVDSRLLEKAGRGGELDFIVVLETTTKPPRCLL